METLPGKMDLLAADTRSGELTPLVGSVEVDVPRGYALIEKNHSGGKGRGKLKEKRRHGVWGLIDQERLSRLRLTGIQFQVLMQIIGRVSSDDNTSTISQARIAREIGSSPSYVSRSIAELKKRRLIREVERGVWKVSRWIYYRGSVTSWEEETSLDPEPILA